MSSQAKNILLSFIQIRYMKYRVVTVVCSSTISAAKEIDTYCELKITFLSNLKITSVLLDIKHFIENLNHSCGVHIFK